MSKYSQNNAKSIEIGVVAVVSLLTPFIVSAATIDSLIDAGSQVLESFIPLLLGVATLVFFWGLVKFINHADDEKAIEEGKQLMLWGMVALFVMVALWAIIGWIQNELGLDSAAGLGTLPSMPDAIP